jgi:hypothetical protein
MFRNTALAAFLVGGAVFGLTACGNDTAPAGSAPQAQAGQDKQKKDAENKPKDAAELKKDVKIVACESGDSAGVSVKLEVTNSLSVPMEYFGTITFRDAAGAEITEGLFNTGTLKPGEKSVEDIPGSNVYTVVKGATCEVAEVKLDEPE